MTGATFQTRWALFIAKLRHALCRLIDPDGFFNRDASLEIDRLLDESDALRERLKLMERQA